MLDPNEPRPRRYTPEINRAAAGQMADMLIEQNAFTEDRERIAEDLLKCTTSWDNGYRLAKDLDSYCHWDPDAEIVETLDYMSSMRSEQLEKCEKDWVLRTNPTTAFAVGDIVAFDCPRDGERKGPIHSIDAERARYVVDDRGMGNGGVLVPFEDVRAA